MTETQTPRSTLPRSTPEERTPTDRAAADTAGPERMPNVVWLVAARELRTRGRSKAFIFSSLFTLALVAGLIVVPTLLGGGPTTYQVGVVDEGGRALAVAAEQSANADAPADERTTIEVQELADRAAAEEAIDEGTVDAVLVGSSELLVQRSGGFGGGSDLPGLLQQAAGSQQVTALAGPENADEVAAALSGQALEVTALSGRSASQSQGRAVLAYGGLMLTYILILQYGTWTLSSVTEEKTNRVIEILLSTARAWQIFAGKVLGVALLGLGQFVATLAVALVAIRVTGAFSLPSLPVGFAAALLVWVLIGFGIYLMLYGAAGSLAAKMEDAQSAVTPVTLVIVVGFFASFAALSDPSGIVAVIGTFVPVAAPFIVPIRVAQDAIPFWQHGVALVLSLLAMTGITLLSGRVYRGGALRFSSRTGWRQALRRAE